MAVGMPERLAALAGLSLEKDERRVKKTPWP
jgi:hypothetical protein